MASPFPAIWKDSGEYVFTTGDNHIIAEQVEFNNTGMSEYFVDMTMSLQTFETTLLIQQDLTPSLCLYMHTQDGKFVGLSRTSVRGKRAWLAGISLVPGYRGRGIGPLLFGEYLNLLTERSSVEILQFECINENIRALKMYKNFGCLISGALYFHHVDITAPATQGGTLELVDDDNKIDPSLSWLQHTTVFSWQRQFRVLLSGVHRQFLFKRSSGEAHDQGLALAVDATRHVPRVDGVAYNNRPTAEEFLNCLRRVAADLGASQLDFANGPETSDIAALLEVVGRRDVYSQKHLTLAIERP